MSKLYVLVPASPEIATRYGILAKSAIVYAPDSDGIIYYEGNKYGASNLTRFTERLDVAAGRAIEKYPTVAKVKIERPHEFTVVGEWDTDTKKLTIFEPEKGRLLDVWLDQALPRRVDPKAEIAKMREKLEAK